MDFQIGKYQVYYHPLLPSAARYFTDMTERMIAQILLYDTNDVYRGDLTFHKIFAPDALMPNTQYDRVSKTFQMRMHESQLMSVLDTLRNEKPCFIRYYDSSDPILSSSKIAVDTIKPIDIFNDIKGKIKYQYQIEGKIQYLQARVNRLHPKLNFVQVHFDHSSVQNFPTATFTEHQLPSYICQLPFYSLTPAYSPVIDDSIRELRQIQLSLLQYAYENDLVVPVGVEGIVDELPGYPLSGGHKYIRHIIAEVGVIK